MALKLYNSLTRKKETFKPQNPKRVTMYTCGPTVYGPSHLGGVRSYVGFDLLKRTLELNGYKVRHVLNITDVHDSMIEQAAGEGISINRLADRFIKPFYGDLKALNIEAPDVFPRVTEHIGDIIAMIEVLVGKGYAYEKGGSVYYDVSEFKDYGKLSGIKLGAQKSGTRVATDKYEKKAAQDFALWKAATEEDEKVGAAWDSPWGRGRPGWHIECSVMAKKHLAATLDIHAGGQDLKFPHHENEIAQSEAANGVKFANYWVHPGLLTVEGQKMSKSLGNYVEFHEIKDRGFNPLAFRYLCLTTHYRSEMNFTWKALEAAGSALDRIYDELKKVEVGDVSKGGGGSDTRMKAFTKAVNDDLDLPKALTVVWELVKDDSSPCADKRNLLLKMDKVLGLAFDRVGQNVPAVVVRKVEARARLRKEGSLARADEIREKLAQQGYKLEDKPQGGTAVFK